MDHESSVIFFLATSLLIGIFTCFLAFKKGRINWPAPDHNNIITIILLVVLIILLWQPIAAVFEKFPFDSIDATQSDIIPQIQTMVDWAAHGVFPYQPIIDWGYELFPTYLPLTWLPFFIPEILQLDYRIFSVVILFLGLFILFWRARKNTIGQLVSAIFFYFLLVRICEFEDTILGYSIEAMVAGFYLLFISSWSSKKQIYLAAGILLCLLSRYSLVIWLPIYFVFLWKKEGFNFSFKTGLIVFLGVVLIYVIPFLSQDLSIYKRGMQHHAKAAKNEWKGQPWQEDPTKPYSLYKGMGVAYKFFEMEEESLDDRLSKLQTTHLALLIFITLLFSLILYLFYSRIADPPLFLLGSFKVYLAVFYHFIQIPYSYIFLVLLVINIPILMKVHSDA